MNFRDLSPFVFLAFVKAAESKCLSSAARELGVSVSAVSQSLEKLEKLVGYPLLDKSKRPFSLTPEGRELLPNLKRFVEEAILLQQNLQYLDQKTSRFLRIGFSEVADHFLASDVEKLLVPQLTGFKAKSGLIPQIVDDFEDGLLDIVISPGICSEIEVERVRLLSEDYFVVCHKDWQEYLNRFFEIDSFHQNKIPFLSYRADSFDRSMAQRFLRQLKRSSFVPYEFENTESLVRAVENRLGWTILPPLNLLYSSKLESLTVRQITGYGLRKDLYAASRGHKNNALLCQIHELVRKKIVEKTLPNLKLKCANLAEGIHLG